MEATKKFKAQFVWYALSGIFFIFTLYYLFKANDFMHDGLFFQERSIKGLPSMRYVGGDAYNYIISGTYSTTVVVRALIFTVLSTTSVIVGKLTAKK